MNKQSACINEESDEIIVKENEAITLCLACSISMAVCVGLSMAIIAGIAYGYNYSLAEFMTLGKSELTVYVRRGQFYEEPDVNPKTAPVRRMGHDDLFTANNISSDYQDQGHNLDAKPLSDSWGQAHDVKQYAEKLTKYHSTLQNVGESTSISSQLAPQTTKYAKLPWSELQRELSSVNTISTALWQDGTSEIVMRKFELQGTSNPKDSKTMKNKAFVLNTNNKTQESDNFYDLPLKAFSKKQKHKTGLPLTRTYASVANDAEYEESSERTSADIKIALRDRQRKYDIPGRRWGVVTTDPIYLEEHTEVFEKVDDGNV